MACDCIERVDAKLAEASSNTRLTRLFPLIGNELGMTVRLATEQVIKARGRKAWEISPTFCPFCGVRYRPDAPTEGAAHG